MKIPLIELFTPPRREFIAKSIMDMLKFVVGAALASGFFVAFGIPIRVAIAVAFPLLFFTAWILHPPRGGH